METQTVLQVKVERGLKLTNEELDCVKFLLGEFREWKKLKNTKA